MSRFRTGAAVFAAAAVSVATLAVVPVGALAPTYFPAHDNLSETAYSLRFAGDTRFSTASAAALVSAYNSDKTSGFPFDEPDPTQPAKAYGMGACPGTVLIAASDGLPDALASASLRGVKGIKIPNNTHAFDLSNAVLLLTDTARQPTPPSGLNADTTAALNLIKTACPSFDAIILGGTAAVPASTETDLGKVAANVGRVAGTDRFDTAAQIASAVAAAKGLPSVPTYKAGGSTPQPSTVFLAEGGTGADALAAGPVAADLDVPVLLTNSASLPAATSSALGSLKPTTIIVLGGTAAISDAVVIAAKTAATTSATPMRIAGANRYDTSVQIAQTLDNLFPAAASNQAGGTGAYSDQLFGLARSEGSGSTHVGWPDALASSFILDSIFANGTAPKRLAPPIETNAKTTIGGVPGKAKDRPALLLTPATALASEVDTYLKALYPAPGPGATDDGGFAYVFGGTSAIGGGTELTAAQDLSNGTYTSAARSDLTPRFNATGVGFTSIDLTKYVNADGDGGLQQATTVAQGPKVCLGRNAASGVQWLDTFSPSGLSATQQLTYAASPTLGKGNVPVCVAAPSSTSKASMLGLSLSGNESDPVSVDYSSPAVLLKTNTPGAAAGASSAPTVSPSGASLFTPASPTGPTTVNETWNLPFAVTYQGASNGGGATLSLTFTRTSANSPGASDGITCSGSLIEAAPGGAKLFTATLTGESATVPVPLPPTGNTNTVKCIGIYVIGTATGVWHATVQSGGTPQGDALSDLVLDGNA